MVKELFVCSSTARSDDDWEETTSGNYNNLTVRRNSGDESTTITQMSPLPPQDDEYSSLRFSVSEKEEEDTCPVMMMAAVEDQNDNRSNQNGGIPSPTGRSSWWHHTSASAGTSSGGGGSDFVIANSLLTRHSAVTVPTSNAARSTSPPLRVINHHHHHHHPSDASKPRHHRHHSHHSHDDDDNTTLTPPRRNIFGAAVEQRYQTTTDFSMLHPHHVPLFSQQQQQPTLLLLEAPKHDSITTRTHKGGQVSGLAVELSRQQQVQQLQAANGDEDRNEKENNNLLDDRDPETADSIVRDHAINNHDMPLQRPLLDTREVSELTIDMPQTSSLSSSSSRGLLSTFRLQTRTTAKDNSHTTHNNHNKNNYSTNKSSSNNNHHNHIHGHKHKLPQRPHETIHAQSFLLGLAFSAVWSPSNLMAPNLTEMAEFFHFDHAQRDLYLGSYCALATSVFSFPMSAGIGILADMVNRKYLFCATLLGGACAALATGLAASYPQLLLARLCNGGFMAGSVPVAFSFLGDLFAVEERNAASSGLTAMMGLGIILGQVYAGTVGPTLGWQQAFHASAAVTLFFSLVCFALVQEPERGGKERVLQDLIRAGTRYERKLSWQGFVKACLQNPSNAILLWQGFFSSLPWGILFVFLNDYLSQERGLSVPAATYLLFLFGMGCAVGGVLGGYWGQIVQRINLSYLPLFMAVTTELGILPFLGLLNVKIPQAHGTLGILFSFGSGLVASLPSVNVRPCLINVNLPETRGATLTAANLLIQLGRGVGPSCVTMLGSAGGLSRQQALNLTLTGFWTISALQLACLAGTLPKDQDLMEAELAKYAESAMLLIKEKQQQAVEEQSNFLNKEERVIIFDDSTPTPFSSSKPSDVPRPSYQSISVVAPQYRADEDEVTIAERMTYFDGTAVNQTLSYARQGFTELKQEFVDAMVCVPCGDIAESSSEDNDLLEDEDDHDEEDDVHENGNIEKESEIDWRQQSSQSSSDCKRSENLLYPGIPPPIQSFSSSAEDTGHITPNEHTGLLV